VTRTLLGDLVIFALSSMVATVLTSLFPARLFDDGWLFRDRPWERSGAVYQDLLRVKSWKVRLPELADFVSSLFPKKSIEHFGEQYMARYLRESRKAELTHWCIIVAMPAVFLMAGRAPAAASMLLLAVAVNLPYIVIQRYNRPRLEQALRRKGSTVVTP
jgi:glycosyl-4,4'-diaponeurosporenoate acyltransferase